MNVSDTVTFDLSSGQDWLYYAVTYYSISVCENYIHKQQQQQR